jgi:small subunit ribosomal protein S6
LVQDYRQPRTYELMTVLIPDLDEEQTNAQVERVQSIVSASGEIAQSLQSSPWGRRRLAYTIRHNGQDYRDGYYLLTYFSAKEAATTEIERDLKLDAQVMRYLLVQSEPYVAPVEEAEGEAEGEREALATEATTTATATAAAEAPAPTETAGEGIESAPTEEQTAPQQAEAEPASESPVEAAPEAGETGEGDAGATTAEPTEEE